MWTIKSDQYRQVVDRQLSVVEQQFLVVERQTRVAERNYTTKKNKLCTLYMLFS